MLMEMLSKVLAGWAYSEIRLSLVDSRSIAMHLA